MNNPIEQLLSGAPYSSVQNAQMNQLVTQVKGMMQRVQGAKDPKQAMLQMIGSNPQASAIWRLINAGGDYRSVALQMARERGIDPQALEEALK